MFRLTREDLKTQARSGTFTTRRGSFETPSFFPVATQAAVKGIAARELEEIGVDGILVNAYHLFLRPGTAIIKQCGGLHSFMGFNKTIITDSGGYQIFSLRRLRKVSDRGVEFQSHIDGKTIFLTPQEVIKIQLDLDSDIIVPLDECIQFPATYDKAKLSTTRTLDWARKGKDYFERSRKNKRLFFGIAQGSVYEDLRGRCLDELMLLEPDGICIGGLSVGEPRDLRYNILSFIQRNTDKHCLRYFMGYGTPLDILEAVSLGADLFDCIVPTRLGRTGTAFTQQGKIVVRNALYAKDPAPLDRQCSCYSCRNFSRAYLRHLINAGEMLGVMLVSYHNVFWYRNFMAEIRTAINQDRFCEFKKQFQKRFRATKSS